MASVDAEFLMAVSDIASTQHVRMSEAAGAWIALAAAAHEDGGSLSQTADNAAVSPGTGMLEMADRVAGASGWAGGAAGVSQQISRQLAHASEASAVAYERAQTLLEQYREVSQTAQGLQEEESKTPANHEGLQQANGEKKRLRDEAVAELERLGRAFALVSGGEVPTAPEGGSGAGAGGIGQPGGSAIGAAGGSGAMMTAANGSQVGVGDYPHSRVLGPDKGDFAGWVKSPSTGFLVDPATGREFDSVTGRWIDPVTGRPFGEVTEYATRLSGLGAGSGAIAYGAGGQAAAIGAGAGLAGLYGGTMPPSVGNTGPARSQMANQAMRNLGQKANVARRFAMHEAGQGGRPFNPPPGASSQRGAGQSGRGAGAQGRGTTRTARGALGPNSAARPPGPGASAHGSRSQSRSTTSTPRGRAVSEPASTWRNRKPDVAARHQLAAPPAGGAARGQQSRSDEKPSTGKPTELTENPDVWASSRSASSGVLGD